MVVVGGVWVEADGVDVVHCGVCAFEWVFTAVEACPAVTVEHTLALCCPCRASC